MEKFLVVDKTNPAASRVVAPCSFNTWAAAARWMLANGLRAKCYVSRIPSYIPYNGGHRESV